MNSNQKIDFVITWVDGSDPKWLEKKNKYSKATGDERISRYREWGTLRYWFRGVEKYAPWVNKIYFVTYGHYPDWLNVNSSKLKIVKHDEFIPKEYLPTFSCRPIEFNLHRIPGLSEQFVYFNDDMFLLRPTKENDFFVNGKPCDSAILDAISVTLKGRTNERINMDSLYASLVYNTAIINYHFNKRDVIKKNLSKWFSTKYGTGMIRSLLLLPWNNFTGFKSAHTSYPLLKSTYNILWEKEYDALHTACQHKFRVSTDVSSRLLSYWQICEGNFEPVSPKNNKQVYLANENTNNKKVFELIRKQSCNQICINDECTLTDISEIKRELIEAFDYVLPKKSQYEI